MNRPVYVGTIWDEMSRARICRAINTTDLQDDHGRRLQIVVRRYTPQRSVEQNRLYQQYARIVAKATGNAAETVKRTWQAKFLGFDFDCDVESSELATGAAHSSHLNVEDFGEFLIQIECWSIDWLDLELPAPGDETAWAVYEQFLKAA